MSLMNLSQENKIEEINLDAVRGKVIIGSERAGVYFLAGNASDYYGGIRDFPDFVKKFGLSTAWQGDWNVFKKKLFQIEQDKKRMRIYTR